MYCFEAETIRYGGGIRGREVKVIAIIELETRV